MRSFSKNSFGFNKITPGVFVGVLIVLIVLIIINPFKSGLSAISNVPGWSSSGTPKNKDTWNTNSRYYSADACAAYAISQGNPGYTWRNGDHTNDKGKNTCVTLKSVEPQNLNSPMQDTGTHTSGCSVQNKQWPNCGPSVPSNAQSINDFINNRLNPLIEEANKMIYKKTYYDQNAYYGSMYYLKSNANELLVKDSYFPVSGTPYEEPKPEGRITIDNLYYQIDNYKRAWKAAVGNDFNESQILDKVKVGDNTFTQQVTYEFDSVTNKNKATRRITYTSSNGNIQDYPAMIRPYQTCSEYACYPDYASYMNVSEWVKLSYTDVYNLYLDIYKYNWLTVTATNELEQVYKNLNNAINNSKNNNVKVAIPTFFDGIIAALQNQINAVSNKKIELGNTWEKVITKFKYLKYPTL